MFLLKNAICCRQKFLVATKIKFLKSLPQGDHFCTVNLSKSSFSLSYRSFWILTKISTFRPKTIFCRILADIGRNLLLFSCLSEFKKNGMKGRMSFWTGWTCKNDLLEANFSKTLFLLPPEISAGNRLHFSEETCYRTICIFHDNRFDVQLFN